MKVKVSDYGSVDPSIVDSYFLNDYSTFTLMSLTFHKKLHFKYCLKTF